MCSYGLYLIFHSKVNIACPCEVIAMGLGKGLHHKVMYAIGMPSSGTELSKNNIKGFIVIYLMGGVGYDLFIIPCHCSSELVVQFTDGC